MGNTGAVSAGWQGHSEPCTMQWSGVIQGGWVRNGGGAEEGKIMREEGSQGMGISSFAYSYHSPSR